jgi:DNA-binding SARP family transcriptional activator
MAVQDVKGGEVVVTRHRSSSLDLLDGFRFRIRSETVEFSDMAQRLVAFVALGGRPLCRSLVAGTLWPEKTEARASANLRSSLWRLNSVGRSPTIICSGSSLTLNPDVRLDVTALERQGWALLDKAAGLSADLRCDWFSKELLPGWYEDWVIMERERLGQLQIRFLEALVHHLRERGEFARAIDQAMRLVAIDPLRERSQLALIRALADEGSWGRARWQADQYRLLLDSTFGGQASSAFMVEYHALMPFEDALPRIASSR